MHNCANARFCMLSLFINFYNLVAKTIQHHDLRNTHTTHSHFRFCAPTCLFA
ncbi:hypothetical protein HMPREF1580_01322 [Gardnerella vaginalis JCP8070]|nr:hypothetical protein HMPREF1580_01322 [Gardnerella vaginalis JCP8070]